MNPRKSYFIFLQMILVKTWYELDFGIQLAT